MVCGFIWFLLIVCAAEHTYLHTLCFFLLVTCLMFGLLAREKDVYYLSLV